MYTISQLAKKFNLSRSTLLYYEKIGLLKASGRMANNYRNYSADNLQRLQRICTYREVGIPLVKVKRLLIQHGNDSLAILEQRLLDLNSEINALRTQQRLIIKLLGKPALTAKVRALNKESWIKLLQTAGLDKTGMEKWHREFEKSAPQAHQDFLESLGISEAEIKKIRMGSKSYN